jgi:site-specific recombinase XerD
VRHSFIPFLDATKREEPNTIKFYRACAENLLAWPKMASCKLDEISSELVVAYITSRQQQKMSVSTINRELATLRRALRLANEWGELAAGSTENYVTRW